MQIKEEVTDGLRVVRVKGGFWGTLVERNRAATLPHVMQQCVEEGHIRNLDIAAGQSDAEYVGGADRDSNLHKVIEGAAYCLAESPDAQLDATIDQWIGKLAAIQEPDGYLQSYFSSQKPQERYADLHRSHELYCMGHMIEAAVEHFNATGKRSMLEIALRVADHIDATFGPGRRETAPGHQELELALVKLYRTTGEKRYLALSRFFVDMRGDRQMVHREYSGKPIIESDRTPGRNRPPAYRQDHLPAVEQREATGHAVRAGYLYAAMADLAMDCHSTALAEAVDAIWNNIVSKKLYITGGVGTHQYRDEGFGDDYLLPNDSAYCETCGGIALLLFSQRMGLLTGEARYADLVELIAMNNMLACTDLAGVNFFYRNPLISDGSRQRHAWCHPACCPTNIVRIVPQIARWIYTTRSDAVYVDQFAASTAVLQLGDGKVRLVQQTNYPWDGKVTITVEPTAAMEFAPHIRIPGWVDGRLVASDLYTAEDVPNTKPSIAVNGQAIDVTVRAKGYCVIRRIWRRGDKITIDLPMPVRRVHAHRNVEACAGRVALMRGPLVYCLEQIDTGVEPDTLTIPDAKHLQAEHVADLLGGVTVIRDLAKTLTAVPYYAWNNRRPGRMIVWAKDAR